MTMMVNTELCTGCGDCVEACPNEAIRLRDGKAFIDPTKCTSCRACAEVCPTGAVQLSEPVALMPVENPRTVEVLRPQAATVSALKRSGWSWATLSLVGRYVLPRLVDVLATLVERRLAAPVSEPNPTRVHSVEYRLHRRHRQRRGR